jgi:acyl-CoA synthetase (NDP forming)
MPEAQPALTHERLQTPRAAALAEQVSASGRELLTEPESKALLSHYGIPVVETRIAADPEQAARLAAPSVFRTQDVQEGRGRARDSRPARVPLRWN